MSKEDLILKTLQYILRRDSLAIGIRNKFDSDLIDEIDNALYTEEEAEKSACDMSDLDRMDAEEDALEEIEEK